MQPTAQRSHRTTDCSVLRRQGFTLVEMLVVVLIISILIGITVKILGGAGRQAAKAVTVNRMERLKHSIEEFYAEYGQYPPAQTLAYEYPWTNGNFMGDVARSFYPGAVNFATTPIFKFGLMSFLLPRLNGSVCAVRADYTLVMSNSQWCAFNERPVDVERFLNAYPRWEPFLNGPTDQNGHPTDQIWTESIGPAYNARWPDPFYVYTNKVSTVYDGWGNEFQYRSTAPYQTYELWSFGSDSNHYIYGHVGH